MYVKVYQCIYVHNKYNYMYESAFLFRLNMINICVYVGIFLTCTYMYIHKIGLSFDVKCSTVNVWTVFGRVCRWVGLGLNINHWYTLTYPDAPWCWYIYLLTVHNWVIYGVNVGKYSSTMEHMGYINQCILTIREPPTRVQQGVFLRVGASRMFTNADAT